MVVDILDLKNPKAISNYETEGVPWHLGKLNLHFYFYFSEMTYHLNINKLFHFKSLNFLFLTFFHRIIMKNCQFLMFFIFY